MGTDLGKLFIVVYMKPSKAQLSLGIRYNAIKENMDIC